MRSFVASCGLVLLAACAQQPVRPQAPVVAIDTVRPLSVAGHMAIVALEVRVHNPNNFELQLGTLQVALGGRATQSDGAKASPPAPAAGDVTFETVRSVPFEAVASAMLPIGANRQVEYEVSGTATAIDREPMPFSGKGTANWKVRD